MKEGFDKWAQEPVSPRRRRRGGDPRDRDEGDAKKLRLINVWATLVRPVRHRVPRPRLPQPHLPRPRLRGGHGQRRRPRQAREGPRVPEGAAGLDAQRRLRQGRPVRAHRGGRRRSGRAPCRTRCSWPRAARSSTAARGSSRPARCARRSSAWLGRYYHSTPAGGTEVRAAIVAGILAAASAAAAQAPPRPAPSAAPAARRPRPTPAPAAASSRRRSTPRRRTGRSSPSSTACASPT